MNTDFRQAIPADLPAIWVLLLQAIQRRKRDGSAQWQNGYPNPETVRDDIEKEVAYVLTIDGQPAGYIAILKNDEPAYDTIDGAWLTQGDFVVVHRLAVADAFLGKGLAMEMLRKTEAIALQNGIHSVKVDTNFDNAAMLHIFEKLGYTYCGEVLLKGGLRKAFEKVLH